ncbi:hypothetical protein ACQ86N_11585 [Puia sp. P3]|uniref:hypothetical protein n=1 Tax=Puia sp. P3 TaxID=3423952 RepID=UPI003D66CA19
MSYFSAYRNYFWVLEEGGEVIAIPGGSTIAYSRYVIQVLEDLMDQGLPPLGALLLAILGTNHSVDLIRELKNLLYNDLDRLVKHNPGQYATFRDIRGPVIKFLGMLDSLPVAYTTGNRRIQLFQLLFADCHGILSREASAKAEEIIAKVQMEREDDGLGSLFETKEFSYEALYDDFCCIELLHKKFPSGDALIEAMAGIPAIDEPILEEEEKPGTAGDFVEELTDNPATFPLGALIRSLWSGMNIPIHHSLPGAQPLGGFSDLSNKGDLDKLLISEFASDDWLFLSRLANNEALYLHREMPPGVDPMERIILVDVSLKSWGTPKILAYAILLAIARHPRTDIPCTAYAIGNGFYPVHTRTVEEVIASIQLVDGALHPAEGLAKFFESAQGPKRSEVFL